MLRTRKRSANHNIDAYEMSQTGLMEVEMQMELNALKKRLFKDSSAKNIKFYPGTNSDASPEDMAREINKYFAAAENGSDAMELDLENYLDS